MTTIAEQGRMVAATESWEIPEGRPWYRRMARLAAENPVGAAAFVVVVLFVFLGLFGPALAPYDPMKLDARSQFLGPSSSHLFGTDQFGHDIFSRTLSGARIDLKFGVIVMLLGFVPGVVLGIISGYARGWLDYVIQRSAEAWTAFPALFLLLTFIAAFGPGLKTVEAVVAISALFSGSRLMRVVALVEKQKEYVVAARATGASEFRLLWRHVGPNIMPFILVGFSGVFAVAVLLEATLSYLGLGVASGQPSWGNDLSFNMNNGGDKYPFLVFFPGLAISVVVLGFNLLGDTLRDILDPRLRGSTGGRK
ncbi:MAG: ABC transporter permease [Dehalococcoidia bacterium]|nr:MAG: ABC transporter permease [Dehalococcoidia bacterium]